MIHGDLEPLERREVKIELIEGLMSLAIKGRGFTHVAQVEVTKIGYPYDPNKDRARYFYVKALVQIGQAIEKDELIWITQGLEEG